MATLIKNEENKDKMINLDLVNDITRSQCQPGVTAYYRIYFTFSATSEEEEMCSVWEFNSEEGRNNTFDGIANKFDAVGL